MGRTDPEYARAFREAAGEVPRASRAWLLAVNTCLYRDCHTGCQRSRCWARRAGDQWHGEPWTEVTLAQCRDCQAPQ